MNVSVGKFFRKMLGRKQSAPTKVVRVKAPQLEHKQEEENPHSVYRSAMHIAAHNEYQAMRAKKRKSSRKANAVAGQKRNINAKGGRS